MKIPKIPERSLNYKFPGKIPGKFPTLYNPRRVGSIFRGLSLKTLIWSPLWASQIFPSTTSLVVCLSVCPLLGYAHLECQLVEITCPRNAISTVIHGKSGTLIPNLILYNNM